MANIEESSVVLTVIDLIQLPGRYYGIDVCLVENEY